MRFQRFKILSFNRDIDTFKACVRISNFKETFRGETHLGEYDVLVVYSKGWRYIDNFEPVSFWLAELLGQEKLKFEYFEKRGG